VKCGSLSFASGETATEKIAGQVRSHEGDRQQHRDHRRNGLSLFP
jgi:hypothetical protein